MASSFPVRSGAPSRRPAPRAGDGLRRLRRIALVAALVVLLPSAISFIGAMSGRSNTALGVRSVEWLRDHGAAGIVAQVEDWYYTLTAPAKGGAAAKAVPKVGLGSLPAATQQLPVYERPQTVRSMIIPALPGEGTWKATRSGLGSAPPLLVTTLRDEPDYPRVFVGLAWIDIKRTQISLYAGRVEPSVSLPSRAMEVPPSTRSRLLATFNSGFKLIDAAGGIASYGGYAIYGHTYSPMLKGLATFVGYTNGSVNILAWSHGATVSASVSYARQNLPLIVDYGRVNPAIGNASLWGATIGNAILVWRSGVGIDRHGNVIYAAGNDQTAASLAGALIRAGAVRAMELDINPYWVSFISYRSWGALDPSNLLPTMQRTADRYLTPDDRDFFAVYLKK
jgi:hypothetical protein